MARSMHLPDRLRALADLVPILEVPDADFGRWDVPSPRDGVQSLGWFEFGPTAGTLLRGAQGGGSASTLPP
jgi:hypothetical protein